MKNYQKLSRLTVICLLAFCMNGLKQKAMVMDGAILYFLTMIKNLQEGGAIKMMPVPEVVGMVRE